MREQDRVAKICLAHFEGFGSRRLRRLRDGFPNYASAWLATGPKLMAAGIPESVCYEFLAWRGRQDPERLLSTLTRHEIKAVLREDVGYPLSLENTHDPPEVLFVRGYITAAPAIAVVGTRRITKYGQAVIQELIPPLARGGLCLVSGLALGVDGEVHRTCLEHRGVTAAFLPGGLDDASLYPREHARLGHDILARGGCLISEAPPGTPGLKHLFPIRNRLIAGFTVATVVVEAAIKSGSLITAKLALEENREVLAVPGPIWNAQSEGTNHLLKLGAKVCTSPHDVLDALTMDRPELVAAARQDLPVSPEDTALVALLTQPTHIDTLSALAKRSVAHVSSQLSMLELKGYVQHLGGQMWVKKRTI